MRVIAGPNGSGKSTILRELDPAWVGVYVNADDLQVALTEGPVDLQVDFGIAPSVDLLDRLRAALRASPLLARAGLTSVAAQVELTGSAIHVPNDQINAYVAAVLADFLRRELLAKGESFTFETVMSSPDKVDFMLEARAAGYRTYLYFVATADPAINLERVQLRVAQGGHDVPEDRVRERYTRSIGLLAPACAASNRTFVFDNSGEAHRLVAEVTDGEEMALVSNDLPAWFTQSELYRAFQ